jgi:hypothetical protein
LSLFFDKDKYSIYIIYINFIKTFMSKTKKILIGIVVVIVAIVALALGGSTGTDVAAEAVLQQFADGKYEEVYNESAMTDDFTLEEFTSAMGVGSEIDMTTAEKVSWNGRGFEGEEKYVYGDLKFTDGETRVATFWFVEVEGELELLGITGGAPE